MVKWFGGFNIAHCCCFDLRTGGLIIGYFQLISSALLLLAIAINFALVPFLVFALIVSVHGCWIYGVHTESTQFMLPGVILEFIALSINILSLLSIPSAGATINKQLPADSQMSEGGIIAILFIIAVLVAALQWLFTAVKYSLYKQMKQANQPNAGPIANNRRINVSA